MQKNLLQFCSVGFINNCFHDIAHGESYFGSVLIMLIPFIYIFREKSNLNDEHDFMIIDLPAIIHLQLYRHLMSTA